jgi:hypothetical protein
MECRYSSLAFSCFIRLVYAFSIRVPLSMCRCCRSHSTTE